MRAVLSGIDSGRQLDCSREEMMLITAARMLSDRQNVFVGIGLPNVVCNLARRLHAPHLQLVYESGVIGAMPERVPVSIGDPGLVSGAASVCSVADVFLFYLQRRRIDVGFLGAAQIDRFGNLNTTVIGPYDHPVTRLPGSGGACDIASLARSTFVVARQVPRLFVEHVDFITSPGACPAGTGDADRRLRLITDLAVYQFRRETGEMEIASLHPGVTYDELQAVTGWAIARPAEHCTTDPPNLHELEVLRRDIGREKTI